MVIARRGSTHGSGLGARRWVVERTLAWLHSSVAYVYAANGFPRLHEAFMSRGCAIVCWRYLRRS
jgi:hypothetical protein